MEADLRFWNIKKAIVKVRKKENQAVVKIDVLRFGCVIYQNMERK